MRMFKGKQKLTNMQLLGYMRINHSHRHLESRKMWQAWKEKHKQV